MDEYFSTTIFSGYILHGSLSPVWQFVHAVLEHGDFLKHACHKVGYQGNVVGSLITI